MLISVLLTTLALAQDAPPPADEAPPADETTEAAATAAATPAASEAVQAAEDAAAAAAPEEPPPPPPGKLKIELGGVHTTGNAEMFSLNAKIDGSYEKNNNKFIGGASFLFGMSIADADGDGILSDIERDAGFGQNAQRAWGMVRYDRIFGMNSLFVAADILHDRFTGVLVRPGQELGYHRDIVKSKVTLFAVEAGLATGEEFYYEDNVPPGEDFNFLFGAIISVIFNYTFNESVSLTEKLSVFENFLDLPDMRLVNDIALTAALSKRFSFSLTHTLAWRNKPVSDLYRPVDSTLTAALVVNIL